MPIWSENVPAGQPVHALEDPCTLTYDPAEHASQWPGPVFNLNFPSVHGTQTPPFGPLMPALHVQSDCESLRAGDQEPAKHDAHAVVPVDAEYLPAVQSEHTTVPIAAVYVPTAQSEQVTLEDAQVGFARAFPTGHAVHAPLD